MAAPRVGAAWSKLKERTWEDWALGAGATAGSAYVARHEWRRGLRNVGAGARGTGRFAGATVRTMGDFYRANAMGNKPFVVEPYVPAGMAFTVLAVTPLMMLYQSQRYPGIAGPMQQSAATGQPSIGRARIDEPATSWSEFFSWDFWGVH